MNVSFITRAYGASKLLLKANAPTLMVVGGVVSMGAGTVLACKQTLKVEEVLAKHSPDLEKIKHGESLSLESYSAEVARADRFRVYARAGFDLGRLYAPSGVLLVGGTTLVFAGHRILLQRNATLAIAFTTLAKSFETYRNRVIELKGHEYDQYFMNGGVNLIDEKTGELTGQVGRDWDQTSLDPYNRVFEQGATTAWKPDLGCNKMFIHQQRKFAQERLNAQGYLYLSDVYEALGFPESSLSRVVGWKVKKLPDGSKDIPFVDFGLDKPLPDDWKYNAEKAVYLDFNCQGLIVGGKLQKILEKV